MNFTTPIRTGRITSGWGWRTLSTGKKDFHAAIDVGGKDGKLIAGEPIYAICRGMFKKGTGKISGKYAEVYFMFNEQQSVFRVNHLDDWQPWIYDNDIVERGQVIGYVGNTGLSLGPHGHFELKLPSKIGLLPGDDGYNSYRKHLVNPLYYIPFILDGKLVNKEELEVTWSVKMGLEAIYSLHEQGYISQPGQHDDMSKPMEKWLNFVLYDRIAKGK